MITFPQLLAHLFVAIVIFEFILLLWLSFSKERTIVLNGILIVALVKLVIMFTLMATRFLECI